MRHWGFPCFSCFPMNTQILDSVAREPPLLRWLHSHDPDRDITRDLLASSGSIHSSVPDPHANNVGQNVKNSSGIPSTSSLFVPMYRRKHFVLGQLYGPMSPNTMGLALLASAGYGSIPTPIARRFVADLSLSTLDFLEYEWLSDGKLCVTIHHIRTDGLYHGQTILLDDERNISNDPKQLPKEGKEVDKEDREEGMEKEGRESILTMRDLIANPFRRVPTKVVMRSEIIETLGCQACHDQQRVCACPSVLRSRRFDRQFNAPSNWHTWIRAMLHTRRDSSIQLSLRFSIVTPMGLRVGTKDIIVHQDFEVGIGDDSPMTNTLVRMFMDSSEMLMSHPTTDSKCWWKHNQPRQQHQHINPYVANNLFNEGDFRLLTESYADALTNAHGDVNNASYNQYELEASSLHNSHQARIEGVAYNSCADVSVSGSVVGDVATVGVGVTASTEAADMPVVAPLPSARVDDSIRLAVEPDVHQYLAYKQTEAPVPNQVQSIPGREWRRSLEPDESDLKPETENICIPSPLSPTTNNPPNLNLNNNQSTEESSHFKPYDNLHVGSSVINDIRHPSTSPSIPTPIPTTKITTTTTTTTTSYMTSGCRFDYLMNTARPGGMTAFTTMASPTTGKNPSTQSLLPVSNDALEAKLNLSSAGVVKRKSKSRKGSFICECGKVFNHRGHYNEHVQCVHEKIREHKCAFLHCQGYVCILLFLPLNFYLNDEQKEN